MNSFDWCLLMDSPMAPTIELPSFLSRVEILQNSPKELITSISLKAQSLARIIPYIL